LHAKTNCAILHFLHHTVNDIVTCLRNIDDGQGKSVCRSLVYSPTGLNIDIILNYEPSNI